MIFFFQIAGLFREIAGEISNGNYAIFFEEVHEKLHENLTGRIS